MPRQLHCNVSQSLWDALHARAKTTGQSVSHIVQEALAESLGSEQHSMFQVSTSGAVVQGVYQGCTTIAVLKRHGDFGLGTFDQLDGELIMLDGHCFQARSDGSVTEAADTALTPFATVTRFNADLFAPLPAVASIDDLCRQIDTHRTSPNLFAGVRLTGRFDKVTLRAACRSVPGISLVDATATQSEFHLRDLSGTIVGFWSPTYASSIAITGYHLHFISDDRSHAGHVLGISGRDLALALHLEADLHLALPENAAFLQADLGGNPEAALAVAEHATRR
jgi:acetolactate decarboxylase